MLPRRAFLRAASGLLLTTLPTLGAACASGSSGAAATPSIHITSGLSISGRTPTPIPIGPLTPRVQVASPTPYALDRGAPWLTLPDGWDATWRAALQSSDTTPAWATAVGDSIVQASNTVEGAPLTWPGRAAALLAQSYPSYADWWETANSTSFWTYASGGPEPPDQHQPWSFTSGAQWHRWGLGALPVMPQADSATFTLPTAGAVDVLLYDDAPGTWTYTVAGVPRQVDMHGTHQLVRVRLDGLTAAGQTVTFGGQTGDAVMLLQGAIVARAQAGVSMARCGVAGGSLADYAAAGARPADRFALWSAPGIPTAPAAAVVAFGVNDCQFDAQGAQVFGQRLRKLLDGLRAGVRDCSLIVVADCNPTYIQGAFQNAANWPQYVGAMQVVASDYGAAFVNFEAKWDERAVDLGFVPPNNGHPTADGHADMGNVIGALLAGR